MEKYALGLSTGGVQELTHEDFVRMEKVGVTALELSFSYDRFKTVPWQTVADRAKTHGMTLWSFHLPFMPFDKININCRDRAFRAYSVAYVSEYIKIATDLGIKTIVVHPSAEPNEEHEREELIAYSQDSLVKLADVAAEGGAIIAVENLPRTCLGRDSADIKKLISVDDRLKVCFDTNHLTCQSIRDFVLDVGHKIVTTHFSDYDFVDEKHWMPGEGKIDWPELFAALDQVGYQGPIIYEVDFDEYNATALASRKRLQLEAFADNYQFLKRCFTQK